MLIGLIMNPIVLGRLIGDLIKKRGAATAVEQTVAVVAAVVTVKGVTLIGLYNIYTMTHPME